MKTAIAMLSDDTPIDWRDIPGGYIDVYLARKEWLEKYYGRIITVGATRYDGATRYVYVSSGIKGITFHYKWADYPNSETGSFLVSDLDIHVHYYLREKR